jgi:hypothetical protein
MMKFKCNSYVSKVCDLCAANACLDFTFTPHRIYIHLSMVEPSLLTWVHRHIVVYVHPETSVLDFKETSRRADAKSAALTSVVSSNAPPPLPPPKRSMERDISKRVLWDRLDRR